MAIGFGNMNVYDNFCKENFSSQLQTIWGLGRVIKIILINKLGLQA